VDEKGIAPAHSSGRRARPDPAEFTEILQQHVRKDWKIIAAHVLPGSRGQSVAQSGVLEQSHEAVGQLAGPVLCRVIEDQAVLFVAHKIAETRESGDDRNRSCSHCFRYGDAKRLAS
jgi:hypothetical protein